jgi:hypothetical protein
VICFLSDCICWALVLGMVVCLGAVGGYMAFCGVWEM